jgi:molybdopterin/thiamine biosynthesis adenylyltransferase
MSLSNALEYTHVLNTQYYMPKNIIVVGAGGTGGYLIPNLARQVSLQNKLRAVEGVPAHQLTIIEADEVELKNLTRQNFIERDVTKNKGQVMAERYGAAFGLTINYVPEYVQSREQLDTIIRQIEQTSGTSMTTVIVDCVDNNKTRMILEETARNIADQRTRACFLLSSGNEEWAGQVVCSYLPRRSGRDDWKVRNVRKNQGPKEFRTPLLTDMFPEVRNADDKLPTEMSCAERAVSAPQQILTNMVSANLLFTFLNTILTAKEENNEGLQHFAVHFDAQHSVFRTIFNKESEIIKFYR